MRPYGPYAHPIGSFLAPVPPPPPDDEGGGCVCVSFPYGWLPYMLGALSQLLLQSTWKVDTADEFRAVQQRASDFIAQIAAQGYDPMTCGCTGVAPLTRWTEDGVLQVSNDGGLTWSDYPQGDPRINGNYFPPLALTGTTGRCAAAENIVANMIGQIDQYADGLDSVGNMVQLAVNVIGPAIAFFLGPGGELSAFVTILTAQLFSLGASAVRAAFDDDVWDRLTCNIYCNTDDDGVISAAEIAEIKAKIGTDETGVTALLLNQMIDTLGPRGMTNQARLGGGDGDTCGECDCSEPCEDGCETDTQNIAGQMLSLPTGFSFSGDIFAFSASGVGFSSAGEGDMNFPERCVTSFAYNYDVVSGDTLDITVGTQTAHYVGPVSGTGSITLDPPEHADKVTLLSPFTSGFGPNIQPLEIVSCTAL